jgi:hypothetical protein
MEGLPFGIEHADPENKDGKEFGLFAEMPSGDHENQENLATLASRGGQLPSSNTQLIFNQLVTDGIFDHQSVHQNLLMQVQAQHQHQEAHAQAYLRHHPAVIPSGHGASAAGSAHAPLLCDGIQPDFHSPLDALTCPTFPYSAQHPPYFFCDTTTTNSSNDTFTVAPAMDIFFYHHNSPFNSSKRGDMEYIMAQNSFDAPTTVSPNSCTKLAIA